MSATLTCTHCRRKVAVLEPGLLLVEGAADAVAEAWADHADRCQHTCPYCAKRKWPTALTCKTEQCLAAHRRAGVEVRIDDVRTLLLRTSDAETIAAHFGVTVVSLRRWLTDHGCPELAAALRQEAAA